MTANEDLVLLLKYFIKQLSSTHFNRNMVPLPTDEELMEIVLRWKKEAF